MPQVRCSAADSIQTGSRAPRKRSTAAWRSSTRRSNTSAPSSRTWRSSNSLDPAGYAILERLRARIPGDRILILDAKRGDMGNTALAYARALFDVLGADCVTVNPLLGSNSVHAIPGARGSRRAAGRPEQQPRRRRPARRATCIGHAGERPDRGARASGGTRAERSASWLVQPGPRQLPRSGGRHPTRPCCSPGSGPRVARSRNRSAPASMPADAARSSR